MSVDGKKANVITFEDLMDNNDIETKSDNIHIGQDSGFAEE
jgi:hypothetical protein